MQKLNLKNLLLAATLFAASTIPALAVPFNITVNSGADVIAVNKSGSVGDPEIWTFLTGDVTAYNTLHSTTLPAPVGGSGNAPLSKTDVSNGGSSVTLNLTGTYSYVVLHWGGKGGGWLQVYDLIGYTGSFEFDAPPGGHPDVGGLSSYSFYGSQPTTRAHVADGASTEMLLGLAFVGLFISRKFATAK